MASSPIFNIRPECLIYQVGGDVEDLVTQMEDQDAFCQVYNPKQLLKELRDLNPNFAHNFSSLGPETQAEVGLLTLSYLHDGELVLSSELTTLDLEATTAEIQTLRQSITRDKWQAPVALVRPGQDHFVAYLGSRACPTTLAMMQARLGVETPLLAPTFEPAVLETALVIQLEL